MNQSRKRQNFFAIIILGLMLATALPATALGQGRGRGRDRNRDWNNDGIFSRRDRTRLSKHDRKCAKFRNCHDARDGRWDGRGPRSSRVSLRNRYRRYDNSLVRRNRNRDRDRDRRNNWRNRN